MTERILGPTGSRRRRRFLWVPMLAIAALALFVIASAQGNAPQSQGIFQLDGNAQASAIVAGLDGAGSQDWDNICPSSLTGGAGCLGPSTSSALTAQSFVRDGNGVDGLSIFTGGGSKDD